MKIAVINGPNLNILGQREPSIYGKKSYNQIIKEIKKHCRENDIKVKIFQSNHEGKLIDYLHKNSGKFSGVVINGGGLSHYSVSLRDAVAALKCPVINVHISDIKSREKFRKKDLLSKVSTYTIAGHGTDCYLEAIEELMYYEK